MYTKQKENLLYIKNKQGQIFFNIGHHYGAGPGTWCQRPSPLICMGWESDLFGPESTIISLLFEVLVVSLYAVWSFPRWARSQLYLLQTSQKCCLGGQMQSWAYRVYSRGLSTHPWGESGLRPSAEESWGPSLTFCGRSLKKSLIQGQAAKQQLLECWYMWSIVEAFNNAPVEAFIDPGFVSKLSRAQ